MQIDVTVNMTLEVGDNELREYAEAYSGWDEEEDGKFDPNGHPALVGCHRSHRRSRCGQGNAPGCCGLRGRGPWAES